MMKNILTFDIEEWFHANYCSIGKFKSCGESNFSANVHKLLELCSKNQCKATFFILGCIGENYRDIVKEIDREGHDIACHGYSHELAYNQTYDNFKEDVKKSVGILENVIGKKVLGFRAPSWSIIEKNMHYLEALEELGLKYDASIFPVKTFLYGIPNAARKIHRPVINGRELGIYEVPTSVFDFFGKGVGYSGGFYFRLFPEFIIKKLIKETNNKKMPAIVYLHPRELDAGEKRLKLPLNERFIHYYNVSKACGKLDHIMEGFEFTSIRDFLSEFYKEEFTGSAPLQKLKQED